MSSGKKPPLVVITGPTAVGKSKIAVELSKRINGAVISADSMQVYRGMDIGTAKISWEEMQGIPHYLIDIMEPDEEFHVVRFKELAQKALDEIYEMGKLPVLCGGTGFYIQALLQDIHFSPQPKADDYRRELDDLAEREGEEALYEKLVSVDPESARGIHKNNRKRIIRALEYYHFSGEKISEHNEAERQREAAYRHAYFGLTMDRAKLYERINRRVDLMIQEGLVDEVKALRDRGFSKEMVSMQGLGYMEILEYLEGTVSEAEAIERIKTGSRHYAKRQLTWMRRERDVIWIDRERYSAPEAIIEKMLSVLKEKEIIS